MYPQGLPFLTKIKQPNGRYALLFIVGVHCLDSIPVDLLLSSHLKVFKIQ